MVIKLKVAEISRRRKPSRPNAKRKKKPNVEQKKAKPKNQKINKKKESMPKVKKQGKGAKKKQEVKKKLMKSDTSKLKNASDKGYARQQIIQKALLRMKFNKHDALWLSQVLSLQEKNAILTGRINYATLMKYAEFFSTVDSRGRKEKKVAKPFPTAFLIVIVFYLFYPPIFYALPS